MKKLFCTLMLATLATAAANASEVTISFSSPNQTVASGATIEFFGNIANNTNQTIYLTSDDLTLAGAGFTLTDQFFANVPIDLAPGTSSGLIELFDVTNTSQSAGSYLGTYTLVGGADGGAGTAQDSLGSTTFSADVAGAATPEPDSIWLLLTGLAGASMPAYRKLRATIA